MKVRWRRIGPRLTLTALRVRTTPLDAGLLLSGSAGSRRVIAGLAESVDAPDLKSGVHLGRAGSTPAPGTHTIVGVTYVNRREFILACAAGAGSLTIDVGGADASQAQCEAVLPMPTWLVGIIDTEHPWRHSDGTSTTIRHAGVIGFDEAPLTDGFDSSSATVGLPRLTRTVSLSDGVIARLAVYAPAELSTFGARINVGGAFMALEHSGGGEIPASRLIQVACNTQPDAARLDVTYIVGVRAETPDAAIEAARPLLPEFNDFFNDLLVRTTLTTWLVAMLQDSYIYDGVRYTHKGTRMRDTMPLRWAPRHVVDPITLGTPVKGVDVVLDWSGARQRMVVYRPTTAALAMEAPRNSYPGRWLGGAGILAHDIHHVVSGVFVDARDPDEAYSIARNLLNSSHEV